LFFTHNVVFRRFTADLCIGKNKKSGKVVAGKMVFYIRRLFLCIKSIEMSKRNKLQKFAEVLQLPNVYENYDAKDPKLTLGEGQTVDLRGQWGLLHFQNTHPLIVELACGRGEYSLALARQNPEKNFIGVDIKGARIWKGATLAIQEGLSNVAFLRTRIEQLGYFFAPGEISEIWITFPDPFPERDKENRRLTSPRLLDVFRPLLVSGGVVHLKTDDHGLYAFTHQTLANIPGAQVLCAEEDIYGAERLPLRELEVKTYYETRHLMAGKTIKYLQFLLY
jgi:tRNA (guanine-N7-)-methyltransferase